MNALIHNICRVIIYARYSSDLQNPKSVSDQIDLCRKEAEAKGWVVVSTRFDEGITGSRDDRPGYQALLEDVRAERCDVILFESLDRLSRDQEHSAHFFKVAMHHEVELYALESGFVDAVRLGFNSTMGAAFLQSLAFKTRRGLGARVSAGASGGGLSYGYRVGRETGSVQIDEDEAIIVRRIFREYAAGKSPLKIAAGLNADLIPSPAKGTKRRTSGHWKQNTINGNRPRGTGILNNELYTGRRIWNRLRYSKDPFTSRRVSRLNDPSKWIIHDVPDLAIVDQDLWDAVKERQGTLTKERKDNGADGTLASTRDNRRRKYLLSGLVKCGLCKGTLTVAGGNPEGGKRRYYCANAREKGAAICQGMPGILQTDVEELTLSGLRRGLMQKAAFAAFKADFERLLQASSKTVSEELKLRDRKIAEHEVIKANLLRAVETGEISGVIISRLNEVDEELAQMKTQRAAATPHPVELPDNLPALYKAYVDDLASTLSEGSVVDRAATELRELISGVFVHPLPEGGHQIELEGKLLEMLKKTNPAGEAGYVANQSSFELVAGGRNRRSLRAVPQNAKTSAAVPAEDSQLSLVAGARNFRFLRLVESGVPQLAA